MKFATAPKAKRAGALRRSLANPRVSMREITMTSNGSDTAIVVTVYNLVETIPIPVTNM